MPRLEDGSKAGPETIATPAARRGRKAAGLDTYLKTAGPPPEVMRRTAALDLCERDSAADITAYALQQEND